MVDSRTKGEVKVNGSDTTERRKNVQGQVVTAWRARRFCTSVTFATFVSQNACLRSNNLIDVKTLLIADRPCTRQDRYQSFEKLKCIVSRNNFIFGGLAQSVIFLTCNSQS